MFKEITIRAAPTANVSIKATPAQAGLNVGSNGGMPVLLDQKQADWQEADEASKAFIKNKPTKLSQWENDKNFLEADQALSNAEILDILMR